MTFLPIVERELRIAARRPATYWLRFFAALAAIVIALLSLWGGGSHLSAPMVAKETFGILSSLAMVFCLFTGVFQTADCLSSEKREGTIGLLFLTDLQGYDVVLGKLAANSLHACYGLLGVLPILAIPLLTGGVTVGEFWRMVVVLLAGLFFSLGVGMFVSSVNRETRSAMGLTGFLIIFTTALLPAIYALIWQFFKIKIIVPFLWPSLGYAVTMSSDTYYNYRTGPHEFWGCILTVMGMGLSGLLLASFILPRAWQEKSQSGDVTRGGSRWRRLRFGTARRREAIRGLLTLNPFRWLAVRDRLSRIGFWSLAGIIAPIWLLFLLAAIKASSGPGFPVFFPFQMLIFITFGLNLVFKCLVAAEASRRLCDDRQSGALELLLVTPLSVKKILDGQRRALGEQFLLPILLLEFLMCGVVWLQFSTMMARMHDDGLMVIIMLGNMIVLITDFAALQWVGMWAGLRGRNHHRAVLRSLLQILVVPWLVYFLLGVAGFFRSNGPPVAFFTLWFILCVFNDAIWAKLARAGLKREFRERAAGTFDKKVRPLENTMEQLSP